MKYFPYLLALAFGVMGFILGRSVGPRPSAKGEPPRAAPATAVAGAPDTVSSQGKAEPFSVGVKNRELLPGIDISSEAKCMAAGSFLGSRLYAEDPELLINTLESALSGLPEHLRPAFWSGFRTSYSEMDTTFGHIEKLSRLDPKLVAFLNSTKLRGNENVFESLVAGILVQGIVQNGDETAKQVLNLPGSTKEQTLLRDALLASMAASKITQDPKAGLILIEKLEPNLRAKLGSQLIRRLAHDDSPAALSYFLSDKYLGKADSATAGLALQSYVEIDPEQASAQIRDAPPSAQKDEAAMYLSGRIAQTDFELALKWAESVANLGLRRQAIKNVHDRQKNPVPSVVDLIKSN